MLTNIDIKGRVGLLQCIKSLEDLAEICGCQSHTLQLMALNPIYSIYTIKKANGKNRLIEDPADELKALQRTLNDLLQAYYYSIRPEAAFGFQLVVKNEKHPRNIKTNAQKHIGKDWLLNIDFSDFFHQISETKLRSLFQVTFGKWENELIALVSKICTYRGRLPMGAPTSPVLANWAVFDLDKALQEFSQNNALTYTRFVDDLSFSANNVITDEIVSNIIYLCKSFNLTINHSKTKLYPPSIPKIVTGLIVDSEVTVDTGYCQNLQNDIEKFGHALQIQHSFDSNVSGPIEKARQQIEGRIQFLAFIEGKNNKVVTQIKKQYEKANIINPFEIIRWQDFDYQRFIP